MDFGLQFENDEGDYVVLNSSDKLSLRVAITSAKIYQEQEYVV